MLSPLFIAALWSPAGKGLTSWLSLEMLNCIIVTLTCGILGQVWYLIVSIPGLCPFLTSTSQRAEYFLERSREDYV